jgi:PAS domain S-box-containing protein
LPAIPRSRPAGSKKSRFEPARPYRDLLEAAPDGIIEVDSDGRIVLLNGMVERLFGYSREELLGQSVDVLVPEGLRSSHARHRENYGRNPVIRPMGQGRELLARRKDGSWFPVEISLSPSSPASRNFRVIAILRDVTDRKRMEKELLETQQKLNQELRLRAAESERANQLKSEFLANMSHELRSPLHTIIGFSELLGEELEGPLNEKQKRFVQHIHKDSLHLLQLINDLLDISKIEAGRVELRVETFSLPEAAEEVLSSLRQQAEAKSITLKSDLRVEQVRADRLRFKQILLNLLSNALKFTPAGGCVTLSAVTLNGYAEFSVQDTGIGIPISEHELIFDKFYQARSVRREGTGLGLAITRRLVEQHGGKIRVESEPNRGSRFVFTIPSGLADAGS